MTLTTEQFSQIKADIAARKAMPEYGGSVEGNIERLRVIGETRSHFSTETVEILVRALEEKSRALADAERERDDWVEHSRKMEYRAIEAKEKLANREAQPVPTGKFAGYGLYHAERDEFGSWLKTTPQSDCSDAITKHGYVNVKLFTSPPAPAVPGIDELRLAFERAERESDDGFNLHKYGIGYADEATQSRWESWLSCRAAMLAQPVSQGYTLPPHVYRELVNCLRDTAVKYQGTQQLREQLSRTLMKNGLSAAAPEGGNGA